MKFFLYITMALCYLACSTNQADQSKESVSEVKKMAVEASCGQCQFNMKGVGCDLAVRIDGQSYFVDGTSIDDHGDAHASDGFCSAIRMANIDGEIEDGRFVATSFQLIDRNEK